MGFLVLGLTTSVAIVEALAAAIPAVPRTQLGIVLTTTAHHPRRLALPHDYKLLDIREIVAFRNNDLMIDKARLGAWLKGFRKGLNKPAAVGAGRPSYAQLTEEIYKARRGRNMVTDKSAEAKAIRAEAESRFPNAKIPVVKTIEGHMRQISTRK